MKSSVLASDRFAKFEGCNLFSNGCDAGNGVFHLHIVT